jgi:hypothetical protein
VAHCGIVGEDEAWNLRFWVWVGFGELAGDKTLGLGCGSLPMTRPYSRKWAGNKGKAGEKGHEAAGRSDGRDS